MNFSQPDIERIVKDNCGNPPDPKRLQKTLDIHKWHLDHIKTNPLRRTSEELASDISSMTRLIDYEQELLSDF